jgi:Flp pilus assembly protein TadG
MAKLAILTASFWSEIVRCLSFQGRRRRGVVMAEAGIVYSVAILLVMGTMVVGLGIFRYQEVANLAGEGARWASLRGSTYQAAHNTAAPTSQDVLAEAVVPKAILLDTSKLSSTLTWNNAASAKTVTYTLSYQWTPEMFLAPIMLRCTSTQPVTY